MSAIRPVSILLILMTILFSSTAFQADCSNQSDLQVNSVQDTGEPEVTLSLQNDELVANVDPESDGMVALLGTVNCKFPDYTPNNIQCTVFIRAETGDWMSSVPPELYFSKGITSQQFVIHILVPLGSLVTDSRSFMISGYWAYTPGYQEGSVETSYFRVNIQPYSYLQFEEPNWNISIPSGDSKTITTSITNLGNTRAEVTMGADSGEEGIMVELPETKISVPSNQAVEIVFVVKETKGLKGIHSITLWAEDRETSRQGRITQEYSVQSTKEPTTLSNIPLLVPGLVTVFIIVIFTIIIFLAKGWIDRRRG